MKNKKLLASVSLLIIILIIGGVLAYGYYQKLTYKLQRPIVSMEIENYGTVKIELYPDEAPNTVKNFIKLINEEYYKGLTFHRVEESLIQGGDKEGDGTGKTEYTIKGEFKENGFDNTLKFERGTIGIARQDYSSYSSIDPSVVEKGYNSGYSQFFILTEKIESLDENYTAFGKVVEGIEIIDEISKLETETETNAETGETTKTTKPVNPPIISNITVETYGFEYGEPEVQTAFDFNSWLMEKYYGISIGN